MVIILIIILLILLGVIAFLSFTSIGYKAKLAKLKSTNQKINLLGIIQDFIKMIGSNTMNSREKVKEMNELIVEKYEIKYSTIVIFNGNQYVVEASNVNQKHWKNFEELHNQEIFRECIDNATPKYITAEKGEKLPYLDSEFERAKSTIFFPLYVDNIYIGYWLIEGNNPHEFDHIDTAMLDVVKNNILSAVKALRSQRILENISHLDKTTGLYNEAFLYGEGSKVIDKYPVSIVSLIKITNLNQIEEKVSKKTANEVLNTVVTNIAQNLSPEYIMIRYDENKIGIVFSGSDMDGVGNFLEDLKQNIEKLKVKTSGSISDSMNGLFIAPKLNIALTTYYKETELEEVLKESKQYLDSAKNSESDITCL